MTFHADIRQWPTIAAFQAHLAAHPPVPELWGTWIATNGTKPVQMAWKNGSPSGLVVHHTYRPTPDQWRGQISMEAQRTWFSATRGWQAGPHLYAVIGSPDPANDGLWQLTPLNLVGIHAGTWNRRAWGIEVVGDYDRQPWPAPLRDLVIGAIAALWRWRSWSETSLDNLRGHREVPGTTKSCPGSQINMHQVRTWVRTEIDQ